MQPTAPPKAGLSICLLEISFDVKHIESMLPVRRVHSGAYHGAPQGELEGIPRY